MNQKTKENPPSGGCPRGERAEPEPKKRIAAFHNKTLERRAKRELADDYRGTGDVNAACARFLADRNLPVSAWKPAAKKGAPIVVNRVRPGSVKRWVRYRPTDPPPAAPVNDVGGMNDGLLLRALRELDAAKARGLVRFAPDDTQPDHLSES